MIRAQLLEQAANWILETDRTHPLRVAVDGIDAAGKTTIADELAEVIQRLGRPVVRASLDHFHRPRAERYRRGKESPEGYYLDSFDYPLLISSLLGPLGPAGDRRYRISAFDHLNDRPVQAVFHAAANETVLIFDGVFLLRPELSACWDYRIFLQVDFKTALSRAVQRDRKLFGSIGEIESKYALRYFPGQQLYLNQSCPQALAELVMDNNEPERPLIVQQKPAPAEVPAGFHPRG